MHDRTRRGHSPSVRISVIGTGYLGATHAACLASWGHDVVGVDSDPRRVDILAKGDVPFHEPGLSTLLASGMAAGTLRFTTDIASVADCDSHFLCVGTPQRGDGQAADLSALWTAAVAVVRRMRAGAILIGKSTVPVGTARLFAAALSRLHDGPVRLAWNPEFLREGQAVADTLRPNRLVFGLNDPADELVLREIYASPLAEGVPAITTSLETAELAKAAANVMLAARISLVNVLAETCERTGADMRELTAVLGRDERIGPAVLVPGIGYGGGCLPKDSRAFAERADELGVFGARRLVNDIDAVNNHQRIRTVELARGLLGGQVAGRRVGVLGAAFKAGSDDIRDSPAVEVACRLRDLGAMVRVYDPRAGDNLRRTVAVGVAEDVVSACSEAELVLVLTEWPEFVDLDPRNLAPVVRRQVVIDGRQVLETGKWQSAGWQVHTLGRGRAPSACAS